MHCQLPTTAMEHSHLLYLHQIYYTLFHFGYYVSLLIVLHYKSLSTVSTIMFLYLQ